MKLTRYEDGLKSTSVSLALHAFGLPSRSLEQGLNSDPETLCKGSAALGVSK